MRLSKIVDDYVEFKKALGMKFNSESVILKAFSKALGDIDITDVGSDSTSAYLFGKGPLTSFWHRKFEALTGFYRYAISRDYVSSSPLPTMIPKRPPPYISYIYTAEEFKDLLKATDLLQRSRFQVDAITFRTLLLLLFNTGLRIAEAMSLKLADVAFSTDLLTIVDSKFHKSRLVPISHRLTLVLDDYAKQKHMIDRSEPSGNSVFFMRRNGLPLNHGCVGRAFRYLCNHCGISRDDGARYQPRVHDIRHAFAVTRLLDWYQQGADVQRLLPHLSTYLGHLNISATQRYLAMTPELLREANSRFERYALSEATHGQK